MDLETLETVRLVAARGGFAPAARALNVDPSTVSRAVAAAERSLGFRIFQRSTRRLAVTEAGARWLARAGPALDELAAAADEAAGAAAAPAGTLRLTASLAFGCEVLAPLLPRFREALPDIALDLVLADANLDLVAAGVDLAIRLAPGPKGDLVSTRLMTTRYRVVVAPGWAAGRRLAAPEDLEAADCLVQDIPDFRTRWRFRRGDKTRAVAIAGAVRSANPLFLREAARAGLGPALLADWLIAADLATGRLVDLFPDWEAAAASFDTGAFALYPSRAFLPARVRAALDFLRDELKGR